MIVDTFMFNDEWDMLEIHLSIMQPYVDRFVILEGDRTWSGRPKTWLLSENLSKLGSMRSQVDVIALEIPTTLVNWSCENYSRSQINRGLVNLDSQDVIIHGDLDEVIDPQVLPQIIAYMDQHQQPVSVSLVMYGYKFDQRMNRNWTGPVVARRHMFNDPQQLYKGQNVKRKDRSHCVVYPTVGGWHWTWIGDDDRIRTKVWSCIESQHRDAEQVLESFRRLDMAQAINHKCVTELVDPQYPTEVQQVLQRYPQYWTQACLK